MTESRTRMVTPAFGDRLDTRLRRLLPPRSRMLVLLVLGVVDLAGAQWIFPDVVPMVSLLLPLVIGSLVLGPRELPWFVVFTLLVLALLVPRQPDVSTRLAVTVLVIFLIGFVILLASFRRSRLGVAGLLGEAMLVDLRDRILRQGGIPDLPPDWFVASELRSAGGTPFAGDFFVASREGERLDVVLVDVSGKGEDAGTRALLLSGALGGLIGALPPSQFLEEANTFLLRQEWDEGFATAVHLSLDLGSGQFAVRSAGHPPAAWRMAGTGRWQVLDTSGPVLGLMEGIGYEPVTGAMRPGDSLLLYTDGMVETVSRDIGLGLDKMLGLAERLFRGDVEEGARRLIDSLGSHNDDRALLLVHRH